MGKSLAGAIEKWRHFFLSANSDIFDVIEHAIILAALDCPKEFKLRRDRIAELLFSCKVTKCFRCDDVGLAVPSDDGEEEEKKQKKGKCKIQMDEENQFDDGGIRERKVEFMGSEDDDDDDDQGDDGDMEVNLNHHTSNYSYGEAEALTDEIEEETQMFREVLRIKEILEHSKDETETVLYNSLRKLQLMGLSVEVLKATEIGKSVKVLEKHVSDRIKKLAKTLVKEWMAMVMEWLNAAEAVASGAEGTPESLKKSDVVDEEEGLPSPPLDEGAFFLTDTMPMEWGEFFDGMDDDGNPRNSGEFNKNHENGRKPSLKNSNVDKRKGKLPDEPITPPTDRKGQQPKRQEALVKKQSTVVKPNKPSLVASGPGRPTKPGVERNIDHELKSQHKSDRGTMHKGESTAQQNKSRNSEEAAVQVKLEASKRKLQERYQEAEKAKKQRTVQVMELRDIPKQNLVQRNPHMRPGNHGRHWANGRR